MQMNHFGIHFDYKRENRRAWLYCTTISVSTVFWMVASFDSTFNYFMDSYSILNIIEYISSSLHQNYTLTAPTLNYIVLLCNLQKRYAVLNQLLRY